MPMNDEEKNVSVCSPLPLAHPGAGTFTLMAPFRRHFGLDRANLWHAGRRTRAALALGMERMLQIQRGTLILCRRASRHLQNLEAAMMRHAPATISTPATVLDRMRSFTTLIQVVGWSPTWIFAKWTHGMASPARTRSYCIFVAAAEEMAVGRLRFFPKLASQEARPSRERDGVGQSRPTRSSLQSVGGCSFSLMDALTQDGQRRPLVSMESCCYEENAIFLRRFFLFFLRGNR